MSATIKCPLGRISFELPVAYPWLRKDQRCHERLIYHQPRLFPMTDREKGEDNKKKGREKQERDVQGGGGGKRGGGGGKKKKSGKER